MGFLLVVVASIPMVIFFNLFPSADKLRRKAIPHVDFEQEEDMFKDRGEKYLFYDIFDDSPHKIDDD